MYILPTHILEQLQDYSDDQIKLVTDVFFTVEWGGKHGEPVSEGALSRIIHPGSLHRSSQFKHDKKKRVDKTLKFLEKIAVVTDGGIQKSANGRPKTFVMLDWNFVPSNTWTIESIRHALFDRVIKKLSALSAMAETKPNVSEVISSQIPALELEHELPKPCPKALMALYDFKYAFNGRVIDIYKDRLISDPLMIAMMIKNGFPVVPFDQEISETRCPKCSTLVDKPEKDNDDTIRFLRPTRDFTAFLPGRMPAASICVNFFVNEVIDAPQVVKYFLTEGRDWPTKPIKAHEFTRCKQCHRCVFFDEYLQIVS